MNTTGLLEAIVSSCFALAVGFLTPLIWAERPILGLVFDPSSKNIQDGEVRRIHSAIAVIAASGAPKLCAVFQVTGTALSLVNTLLTGFDHTSVLLATISVAYVCISLTALNSVVGSVVAKRETEPTYSTASAQQSTGAAGAPRNGGTIDTALRAATRKAVAFHHFGWMMCLVILVCHVVLKNI